MLNKNYDNTTDPLFSYNLTPQYVKNLPYDKLPFLCQQLRQQLVTFGKRHGGHIGSNLGVVELTVALHRVFDSPRDAFIFDVSHQSYVHKMLTGRTAAFSDPQHYKDCTGFTNPQESEHDYFVVGHTGTSLSLALGLAQSRKMRHQCLADSKNNSSHSSNKESQSHVIAIIGDGSLSSGVAFEGLNNIAELGGRVLIILNDNEMSIAENNGGMYENFRKLRQSKGTYQPNFFETFGLSYQYCDEGNDVGKVIAALEKLKNTDTPQLLHLHTLKGKGLDAEDNNAGLYEGRCEKNHWQNPLAQYFSTSQLGKDNKAYNEGYNNTSEKLYAQKATVKDNDSAGHNSSENDSTIYTEVKHTEIPVDSSSVTCNIDTFTATTSASTTFTTATPTSSQNILSTERSYDTTGLYRKTFANARDYYGHQFLNFIEHYRTADGYYCERNMLNHSDTLNKKDAPLFIISPATAGSNGINEVWRKHAHNHYIDTGICEEHAIAFAAGIAKDGGIPLVCTSQTFFQRAYDQIQQELAINHLPAILLSFACGYSSSPSTHSGSSDIAMYQSIHGLTCLAPIDTTSLHNMLQWAITTADRNPVVIRMPSERSYAYERAHHELNNPIISQPSSAEKSTTSIPFDRYRVIERGSHVAILCLSDTLPVGIATQRILQQDKTMLYEGEKVLCPTILSPLNYSNLDTSTLEQLRQDHELIVTLEDGQLRGGWGQRIAAYYMNKECKMSYDTRHKVLDKDLKKQELTKNTPYVLTIGSDGAYSDNEDLAVLDKKYGLDPFHLAEQIHKFFA